MTFIWGSLSLQIHTTHGYHSSSPSTYSRSCQYKSALTRSEGKRDEESHIRLNISGEQSSLSSFFLLAHVHELAHSEAFPPWFMNSEAYFGYSQTVLFSTDWSLSNIWQGQLNQSECLPNVFSYPFLFSSLSSHHAV